ncbi:hypothetical protein IWQ60_002372 [Tieghemiomyces parasiticus]|uniref:Transcription factor TFIIIC triple barrel domain-containing protein n=1 Tax=Tieghemiomyces parasiticus TaxID=78921 RepID=A0A9W8ACS5_9FUNG|nr:hypothetical protein IWQ60_002372 [Tieghemiomyces parasiticus]
MSLASDSDYEEVEEITYVVCQPNQDVAPEGLPARGNVPVAVTAIDSDTPFISYAGVTYRGEYEDAVGSDLIFAVRPTGMSKDYLVYSCEHGDDQAAQTTSREEPVRPPAQLNYVGHTTKVLKLYPVVLEPRTDATTGVSTSHS